jgi:RNA polymerase sigma-70 factor (ECF subfamily)
MNVTAEYLSYKPYLLVIAYNMIGQVQEAEDLVQDSFEDILNIKPKDIKSVKSYLTRIVINKSIDRLTSLKKQRENYPALWLPEPYITIEGEDQESKDILPYSFMHLLEKLNPVERAVVILREAFDYEYEQLGSLCDLTAENCRQILHRAKAKLKGHSESVSGKTEANSKLLNSFLRACLSNDTAALSTLLKEDVMLYSDGGGKVVAARKLLQGISGVVRFLLGVTRKTLDKWSAARQVVVNGAPALLMPDNNNVYMIFIPQIENGQISRIFLMRNPDKIFLKNPVTE